MIAVVDYGVGNLFSLRGSLGAVGAETLVTGEAEALRRAEKIVLPGVGAFGDAAAKLRALGLDSVLREEAAKGKPLLGICLGMQLLFERSFEYGEHAGLGLIPGCVRALSGHIPADFPIPQIGWNALHLKNGGGPLLRDVREGDYVYFVHSYYAADCEESVIADTDYGASVTAAVQRGNVYGCQFHPEKSGAVGMKILKAFCEV